MFQCKIKHDTFTLFVGDLRLIPRVPRSGDFCVESLRCRAVMIRLQTDAYRVPHVDSPMRPTFRDEEHLPSLVIAHAMACEVRQDPRSRPANGSGPARPELTLQTLIKHPECFFRNSGVIMLNGGCVTKNLCPCSNANTASL